MKIAYFIKKKQLWGDPQIESALKSIRGAGCEAYDLLGCGLQPETSLILCFGGDGTVLSAAPLAGYNSIPVIGINMGRLGFLSDNIMSDVVDMVVSGKYRIEERQMLSATVVGRDGTIKENYVALNDVSVRRSSPGMLGINVTLNSDPLPTYWADGVILSTSSGSTAYSLSVGGPICTPDANVFVLAPIASHNLNMRPLVLSSKSVVTMAPQNSQKVCAVLSIDNHEFPLEEGDVIGIRESGKPLKVASTGKSNFIQALQSKLFWGEDVRNMK